MATVTNWVETLNAAETVVYPMVGLEWLWLLIAVVIWLAWHVKQSARETEDNNELASEGKGPDDYKSNITNW